MKQICADQAETVSRHDPLLIECRWYRPRYHAFFSEGDYLKIFSAAPFHHGKAFETRRAHCCAIPHGRWQPE